VQQVGAALACQPYRTAHPGHLDSTFSLMSVGLISAQPSMLALLYAERAGLLRELPH
jgi:hypothetical protein